MNVSRTQNLRLVAHFWTSYGIPIGAAGAGYGDVDNLAAVGVPVSGEQDLADVTTYIPLSALRINSRRDHQVIVCTALYDEFNQPVATGIPMRCDLP